MKHKVKRIHFVGIGGSGMSGIAEGLANKDIAIRLYLSEGTVKNHVSVIMAKLQANSRADVVAKAYREGMVRPRP